MSKQNDEVSVDKRTTVNHDEAFKKLLQTFFKEFIQLFFPELDEQLDHSHTRFLMQELLVDIIPIAIFTSNDAREETNTLTIGIPEHDILRFQFLKVELRNNYWRKFIESDNPVAAALLAKMGYTESDRRELRFEYLRMLLRLRKQLDEARMSLIMSVADLYFEPNIEEDKELLQLLSAQYSEEGVNIMELMPAWKKWGYDEGIEKGLEKGIEKGIEKGKEDVIRKLLDKGFSPEDVAEALEAPIDEIRKMTRK